MAAEAVDGEAIAGRRGDGGDDAEGDAFALEQRALLDVQLDPGVVVVGRQAHGGERAVKPAAARTWASVSSSVPRCAIMQCVGARRVECAGHQPAADAADAEARGLFRGEHGPIRWIGGVAGRRA